MSTQATIYFGTLRNITHLSVQDRKYIRADMQVVLKQFRLSNEKKGFKKELKVLKRIKQLDLQNNGGFPVILSAKISNSLGEIMMSHVGSNIYDFFKLQLDVNDNRLTRCFTIDKVS